MHGMIPKITDYQLLRQFDLIKQSKAGNEFLRFLDENCKKDHLFKRVLAEKKAEIPEIGALCFIEDLIEVFENAREWAEAVYAQQAKG